MFRTEQQKYLCFYRPWNLINILGFHDSLEFFLHHFLEIILQFWASVVCHNFCPIRWILCKKCTNKSTFNYISQIWMVIDFFFYYELKKNRFAIWKKALTLTFKLGIQNGAQHEQFDYALPEIYQSWASLFQTVFSVMWICQFRLILQGQVPAHVWVSVACNWHKLIV